jgi:integrase
MFVKFSLSIPYCWEWEDNHYLPLFKAIYYSGARLAEIAGLRGQDLLEDRIVIQPHSDRSLKSKASERQIPMHPLLASVLRSYRDQFGLIWPELQSTDGRWGANLSRSCKKVTGATPHCFRHRAATRLREKNFNEATICRLLGHTPNTITASYGSIPWERLMDAVNQL